MLILVAVTISMAVNGGLFGYAGNAAKDTELAKQKEESWINLSSGMTTDDLIAKYTTDREKDLEILRKAYLYNNQDAWDELLEDDGYVDEDEGNGTLIIYHNNYFKYYTDVNNNEQVDIINEKEKLIIRISLARDNGEAQAFVSCPFIIYDNIIYAIVQSADTIFGGEYQNLGSTNEIAVAFGEGTNNYTIIRPTTNQTWSNWASTSSDADITIRGVSLKQSIINNANIRLYDYSAEVEVNDYNSMIIAGHIYSEITQ